MKKTSFVHFFFSRSIRVFLSGFVLPFCIFSTSVFAQAKPAKKTTDPLPITVKIQKVAANVEAPTAMAFLGNGDAWLTEQTGKIRVMRNGAVTDEIIMDMKPKLVRIHNGYEEQGLLGIALHPQFASNKKFYVVYSTPPTQKANHTDVLAEYVWSGNGTPVDPASGRIILTADKPEGNHNGGCIQFGPDGYLYLSFGDGGGQHDKHGEIGNGQNLNTWLGKILRIDVNVPTGYAVPKDNPFVGRTDVKPEIWAYGFRNVWRFSFDKATGQLFAGDVGQDKWEEVDIITKSGNYGWRIMEGTHCHNPENDCDTNGIIMPITEYPHTTGLSVTGGYVYNGKIVPGLKGKYIFADWTGPAFYLQKSGSKWLRGKLLFKDIPEGTRITSFGEDTAGEVYILTNPETGPENTACSVYKIVKN